MYDMKALYEAESVENAVALRLEHPEAQIIAGGSDVLVQMREGKRAGKELISIYGLDELRGVTSADSASTLHAWEAIVELTGKNGVRRLPIKDFYLRAGKVDIRAEEGEIQTAILIPKASYENCFGHYIKYAMRNAMDIATTGCSVNVVLSEDKKTIVRARIAYGVAGPVPMRAPSAEAQANGRPVCRETVDAFAQAVLQDIHPRDSWRASKAFREHIAVELARRCLIRSIELAGGAVK